MDYDAVLAQVLTLLQQEQRLAYRVLKLRLQLDDETVEALKDDLIYAKKVAVDEDGKILVWTGSAADQVGTPQAQPQPPEAERRQLTVLFCDLVDSTRLAGQLDPEDYREVVRAYQATCAEVIQRFEGHIAQYLGDGLLVYFGYPQAHEDDAQRAVHTGLGILEAMTALNAQLIQDKGIRLAIRLGIHTGLVVVGEIGSNERLEHLALGDTPNIAARIQSLAAPDTLVISAATYRLIAGYFACDDLGVHLLKGVVAPQQAYRVVHSSGRRHRLEVAATQGLTPLIGREQEVGILLERWQHAQGGQGQVVVLTGEAGIGKSRLVQVLKEHVASAPHTRWECRSSPYYQNTALYPLIDLFQRALHWQQDEPLDRKLGKLEQALRQYRLPLAESVPLFASLLSLPVPADRYPPLACSPQQHRQKTMEALITLLLEQAEQQPVLFILEDLHWTDPTTLDVLSLLMEQTPTASLYTLVTCRPEFQPPWSHRSYLTAVTVNRLSRHQIEAVATYVAGGKTFPTAILQQLVDKTDGVPLYCEEITKALLESGYLKAINSHYEVVGTLPALAIPATLHDSLMARLDRLAAAKGIAQLAAVIGRQFAYPLLQTVSQVDDMTLQRELRRLVDAELVYQTDTPPQSTYVFKHALIQDAAYQSLLKSTRQQYHQHIAQVLEAQFPEIAETQPELLAHHYTAAGLGIQAVIYWQRAGQRSNTQSAYVESVAHCTRGLAVLRTLPDTPTRAQQELDLLLLLSEAFTGTKGHGAPEREQVLARARALCRQAGDPARLFAVVLGLHEWYVNRGEFRAAQALDAECLALAQRQHDPALLLRAHAQLAVNLYFLGEFVPAHAHLAQALALSPPPQDDFPTPQALAGVLCRGYAALILWLLGYPEQARRQSHEMLAYGQTLAHAFSLARALYYAAWLHGLRREAHATQEYAEASLALSTAQGFTQWVGPGTFWRGWAFAMQGQPEAGTAQMQEGLAAKRTTGVVSVLSTYLGRLAEAYGASGQATDGLVLLAEALAHVATSGERDCAAELYRLQGELLLRQAVPNAAHAEASFQQALDIARCQQAKSWELRTAVSLARLWQHQSKRTEAYALLAPVYGWFTEGFDTADLQEAKALLDELT